MKKLMLTLALSLFTAVNLLAGSGLTVISGGKKFMDQLSGSVHLEFIWDNATYDDRQPLTEKFTNLEELKPIAWNGFIEEFNDRSKRLKVVKNDQPAQYSFVMKVTKMDQYFKVMGFIPSNATKVWGTLTITDLASGAVIAEIQVDAVDGGANPSPDGTFSDCFEELGKLMSRLK